MGVVPKRFQDRHRSQQGGSVQKPARQTHPPAPGRFMLGSCPHWFHIRLLSTVCPAPLSHLPAHPSACRPQEEPAAAPPSQFRTQILGSRLPSQSPLAGCAPPAQHLGVALPAPPTPWRPCAWYSGRMWEPSLWALGWEEASKLQQWGEGVAWWTENPSGRVWASLGAEGPE